MIRYACKFCRRLWSRFSGYNPSPVGVSAGFLLMSGCVDIFDRHHLADSDTPLHVSPDDACSGNTGQCSIGGFYAVADKYILAFKI
jgi:hypothetical protein